MLVGNRGCGCYFYWLIKNQLHIHSWCVVLQNSMIFMTSISDTIFLYQYFVRIVLSHDSIKKKKKIIDTIKGISLPKTTTYLALLNVPSSVLSLKAFKVARIWSQDLLPIPPPSQRNFFASMSILKVFN